MTSYKDFPPGWNHVLVPVHSRSTARAGLAMYTPCRWRGELAQTLAWAAVTVGGGGLLPGRSRSWDPPDPADRWAALLDEIRRHTGPFGHHAIYERREGRRGVMLVLIADDGPIAFAKVRFDGDPAIAREADVLELVGGGSQRSFTTPRLIHRGDLDGWGYLVTTALPARRHRMLRSAPGAGLLSDIRRALAELPRPADTPAHWTPMHGDLTPWNLRGVGDELFLIDWEEAGWAPPGADETLYRSVAAALGRPVRGVIPMSEEAIGFWLGRLEERDGDRVIEDRPSSAIDAAVRSQLRAMAKGGPGARGVA